MLVSSHVVWKHVDSKVTRWQHLHPTCFVVSVRAFVKLQLVSQGQVLSPVVPVLQGGMALGMQTPGIQFMGQPQFMGMRPAGPQYTADMQKQMAEEHQ